MNDSELKLLHFWLKVVLAGFVVEVALFCLAIACKEYKAAAKWETQHKQEHQMYLSKLLYQQEKYK